MRRKNSEFRTIENTIEDRSTYTRNHDNSDIIKKRESEDIYDHLGLQSVWNLKNLKIHFTKFCLILLNIFVIIP